MLLWKRSFVCEILFTPELLFIASFLLKDLDSGKALSAKFCKMKHLPLLPTICSNSLQSLPDANVYPDKKMEGHINHGSTSVFVTEVAASFEDSLFVTDKTDLDEIGFERKQVENTLHFYGNYCFTKNSNIFSYNDCYLNY